MKIRNFSFIYISWADAKLKFSIHKYFLLLSPHDSLHLRGGGTHIQGSGGERIVDHFWGSMQKWPPPPLENFLDPPLLECQPHGHGYVRTWWSLFAPVNGVKSWVCPVTENTLNTLCKRLPTESYSFKHISPKSQIKFMNCGPGRSVFFLSPMSPLHLTLLPEPFLWNFC